MICNKPSVWILGKGFIGTSLYNSLSNNSNFSTNLFSNTDVSYKFLLDRSLKYMFKPDIIINASGYTGGGSIDNCEDHKEDCWKYNVESLVKIAEACNRHRVQLVHISTGSIYSGYEKEWNEEDEPNFGLFADNSSFYAKSKHAGEKLLMRMKSIQRQFYPYIFRINMPFTSVFGDRNLFNKILKYDKLSEEPNSMTCLEDFGIFMNRFLAGTSNIHPDIYNIVNMGYADFRYITDEMQKLGINKQWEFIQCKDLNTVAKRSNCILSDYKIAGIGYGLPSVKQSIRLQLKKWIKEVADKESYWQINYLGK